MFGIFKNNNEVQTSKPEWAAELDEAKTRWFSFLEKLEAKMDELAAAAIPELQELFNNDDDMHKGTYRRMQSGILGQLDNIRQKANDVKEEKITDLYEEHKSDISITNPNYHFLGDFRTACSERHCVFEDKLYNCTEQIRATAEEDLEISYNKIMDEYETIKDKFKCKQCGGGLTINKIFFISTYITCSQCQTQNTFEPSTEARNLQHISFKLAEQRTTNLQNEYAYQVQLERDLYFERHTLKLSATFEKDKKIKAQQEAQIIILSQQREAAIAAAPILHEKYLRAKYDELNKIVHDLKEHNEKLYEIDIAGLRSRSPKS